jgi:hypothetical protein
MGGLWKAIQSSGAAVDTIENLRIVGSRIEKL